MLVLASNAFGATASGTYAVDRPSASLPAGHFAWNVAGRFLPLLSEAPLVGINNTTGLSNSDSRYISASLSSVTGETKTLDCADGVGGTNVITKQGVADPRASFQVVLELNLLRNTGSATFAPADFIAGQYWVGQTFYDEHNTCYGQDVSQHAPLDVMAHDNSPSSPLTPDFGSHAYHINWPISRTSYTSHWVLNRTKKVYTDFEDPHTIHAHITFSGTAVGMHASCYLPTVKDLYYAKTFASAKAILARAGFSHVYTGYAHGKAAPKGHFYMEEGIGNSSAGPCGYGRYHLIKSLG